MLYGGDGRDIFIFKTNSGNDTIYDFDYRIDTLNYSGKATIETSPDNFKMYRFEDGSTVTLSGIIGPEVGITDIDEVILSTPKLLHSFEVNEQTPAYWYEDQYYEPTTVQFIPQAAKVVDAHNDQDFDIIMPLNKGYRTGVDTRENFYF